MERFLLFRRSSTSFHHCETNVSQFCQDVGAVTLAIAALSAHQLRQRSGNSSFQVIRQYHAVPVLERSSQVAMSIRLGGDGRCVRCLGDRLAAGYEDWKET